MTRYGETEADDLFRTDAQNRGYLEPGGRGLFAYYRELGMVPPGDEKNISEHYITGLDLERPIPDDE